ncbi:MAG: PLP-dependent aminotransferase family protein [Comamonadaceae bacterium]|nr:MAG: PLP-dependent aminotransferase family protein [Comamonadaceae bacterium]
MTRYATLADTLAERIQKGLYQPGDRLPSVRVLSSEHGVSLGTVQQAYRQLEDAGLAVPRAKSGFYVRSARTTLALPEMSPKPQRPVEVTQWDQVLALIASPPRDDVVQLGRGMPDVTSPSLRPLSRAMARQALRTDLRSMYYDTIFGARSLREQVARLTVDSGCSLHADDFIITTGCHEALSAGIRAVCSAGDIVAVDSPSFHGVTQILKGLGIRALEIPTDPLTGISLNALELALEQWPIKAVQLTPNCNNPLGYIMPDAHKRQLLTLAQRHDIAIIEDDVYGDLAYHYPRPRTIKSMDRDGRVLLCSSFSKTLAPGIRVGWIAPGRYFERVLQMKYIGTGATATGTQHAVADFLSQGKYAQHVRRMRGQYLRNRDIMSDLVCATFPEGTRMSRPEGGFMLWIALREGFDSWELNTQLLAQGVQIAVGNIFSATGKYRHCLRLNYAGPLDDNARRAIGIVGETARKIDAASN